jgi:hypothetical protein
MSDFDLIDLPERDTVDWDEVFTGTGYGCREPFYTSTLKARRKKTMAGVKASSKKQMVQAA